jgi:CBS domain-containing protein
VADAPGDARAATFRSWLRRNRRETGTILVTLSLVVAGLAVLWFAKSVAGLEGEAILVALLVIPLVVYAVASGRLEELRGGGIEARFARVATATVTPDSRQLPVEAIYGVEKASPRQLPAVLDRLADETAPIGLTIVLGKDRYTRDALRKYLVALGQLPKFKFVVFVDPEGRFEAYMPHWLLGRLLEGPRSSAFVTALNEGLIGTIRRYPGVVRHAITTKHTNEHALREMERQGLEAIVVLDEERRVVGVVEREDVLSTMLLALSEQRGL